MLHGFNLQKLVVFVNKFLRIAMPVILTFFNTMDLYTRCAVHTQWNW